jgi:hypothetical protein
VLYNISNADDGTESVTLPFLFQWRGQVNYTQVLVDSNGVIFPGGDQSDGGSYQLHPVELGGSYSAPRIAVWQQDLNPSASGKIYSATVDGVFVISWEGVPHINAVDDIGLNFQVALHAGGNIEIRWGDGNPNEDVGTAGIEDDAAGVTVPATGFPFDNETNGGVAASFPSNQCRSFAVIATGNYAELP